ncbi:MAG: type II secretion system protein GspL [Halothiobacillus sp.]|jgi:general secretion pathway protein L|nr:type II secretion system protein GspL [Halothiobacillus sp.]
MSDRLFLFVTDREATELHWWQSDAPASAASPLRGDWAAFADWLARSGLRRPVTLSVLLPDSVCSRLIVPIPGTRREKALQALPFALEDLVADDLSQLYPVLADRPLLPGRWPVLLVDVDVRTRVLDALGNLNLVPQQLVAMADTLPQPEAGEYSVWVDPVQGHISVLTGPHEGMALAPLPEHNAAEQLAGWLPRMTPAPQRVVFHLPLEQPPQWPEGIAFSAQAAPDWAQWHQIWATGLDRNRPLSAITSARAVSDQQWQRRWWQVGAAALVVLILMLVSQWIAISQMNRQAERLQAQITQDFHAALPQVTRMVNVRVQLQQALDQQNGANDDAFMPALAAFGSAYQAAKPKDAQLAIKSIRFDAKQLTVELTAQKYEVLQQLLEQLKTGSTATVSQIDAGVDAGVAHMRIGIKAL